MNIEQGISNIELSKRLEVEGKPAQLAGGAIFDIPCSIFIIQKNKKNCPSILSAEGQPTHYENTHYLFFDSYREIRTVFKFSVSFENMKEVCKLTL